MADFPTFQFNPAQYNPGVQYQSGGLAQGISEAGQGVAEGMLRYEQQKKTAEQRDAMFDYLAQNHPDVIPADAWDRYHAANEATKNKLAIQAGLTYADQQKQQQQEWQNRELGARANLYIQQAQREAALARAAAELGGPARAGPGYVWSDELGGCATADQAARAKRQSTAGQLQSNYGLGVDQIIGPDASKQHEAGTVTIDPSTGAKKFTNDVSGDQIRVGGASGVTMPRAEFEIYKRQLQMSGYDPTTGQRVAAPGGGATAPAGAAAGTVRVRSPQGVVGTLPANRLQEALNAGYTQI